METEKKCSDAAICGGEMVIVPREKIEPKLVLCDMCGHKNPVEKDLCEKCSNYLKG